eukprot:1113150-Rhodomonas_salina.1
MVPASSVPDSVAGTSAWLSTRQRSAPGTSASSVPDRGVASYASPVPDIAQGHVQHAHSAIRELSTGHGTACAAADSALRALSTVHRVSRA